MSANKVRSDGFRKVADCLYRYESSGKYYAFIRHQGKLIKRSIGPSYFNAHLWFVRGMFDSESREIEELIEQVGENIQPHQALLMPEGISTGEIRGRDETLIDLCKDRGYRYCNRLRIEIFGNSRGT